MLLNEDLDNGTINTDQWPGGFATWSSASRLDLIAFDPQHHSHVEMDDHQIP